MCIRDSLGALRCTENAHGRGPGRRVPLRAPRLRARRAVVGGAEGCPGGEEAGQPHGCPLAATAAGREVCTRPGEAFPMAPRARTPSLKRLAAEPQKDRATPPAPAAQPSDWGHYDTGEKPPEDQNEDNEANDNDDTISWAGDGDHVVGEDFRFDLSLIHI